MKVNLKLGRYVLALSGGVDSMVLLDLLAKQPGVELVLAHFNHGIRSTSGIDERLVIKTAKKYGLKIEVGHGHLGADTSEEKARIARYDFLERVRKQHHALAIITAHHQDDLIETALINILRGTGPRGLVAILNPDIKRPLIPYSKKAILNYAKKQKLEWVEDVTNEDTVYLRNYLRHNVLNKLSLSEKGGILRNIDKVAKTREIQNKLIATLSQKIKEDDKIDRQKFVELPNEVALELLATWLRKKVEIDKKLLQRLVINIKTAPPGTKHDIKGGLWLEVGEHQVTLK